MAILKVANIHFDAAGTSLVRANGANVITFQTASSERVRVDAAGNVLIGRSSSTVGQDVKLDVAGAINASAVIVNGAPLQTTSMTSNVVISVADDSNAALRITQTGAGDALRVEDSANPDATAFVVDASGKVGVNGPVSAFGFTVSNTSALIQGDGPSLIFRETDAGADRTYWDHIFVGGNFSLRALTDNFASANIAYQINRTQASITEHIFYTGTAQTERLRIQSTGNVLIGRTTSTVGQGVILDVAGGINASAVLVNGTPISSGPGGSGNVSIIADTANATRYITFEDSTSGNTTSLNVSTTLTYNPSTGTLSSTVFNSTSDINKKENLRQINDAMYLIDSLKGYRFNWKDNGLPSVGVVAQEVQTVLPELIGEDNSVNYNGLIAVLIEAVKELKAELAELKSK